MYQDDIVIETNDPIFQTGGLLKLSKPKVIYNKHNDERRGKFLITQLINSVMMLEANEVIEKINHNDRQ